MSITTAEQLLRAQHLGRCELIRGELRMLDLSGAEHGRVTARVLVALANHVDSRGLGAVYPEIGFVLTRAPDTVRAPDVAFVRAERLTRVDGYYDGPPDLAVEVVSFNDRPAYLQEKVAAWIAAGARTVWVVDPDARSVTVHEPRRKPRLLGERQTLRGGSALPGLEIPVASIFA